MFGPGRAGVHDKGRTKLLGLLAAGDPRGEVQAMWHAKQVVRSIYEHRDQAVALEYVTRLGHDLHDKDHPPEAHLHGRTLLRWRHQICGWHASGVSNGPTEAINNLTKRSLWRAHRFENKEADYLLDGVWISRDLKGLGKDRAVLECQSQNQPTD